MCWYIKVSVPLLCNLGERLGGSFLDFLYRMFHCVTDVVTDTSETNISEELEDVDKDQGTGHRWSSDTGKAGKVGKTSMADRPLPVPIDKEPYYMNIQRREAENLLAGEPDGTFILRPSSQPNHAYTLSISCSKEVHNIGVRKRPDGRLALGYARKGERSFATIPSLLRHHRRKRLVLVAAGGVIGTTTLKEPPVYYQIPSSLPVRTVCSADTCQL